MFATTVSSFWPSLSGPAARSRVGSPSPLQRRHGGLDQRSPRSRFLQAWRAYRRVGSNAAGSGPEALHRRGAARERVLEPGELHRGLRVGPDRLGDRRRGREEQREPVERTQHLLPPAGETRAPVRGGPGGGRGVLLVATSAAAGGGAEREHQDHEHARGCDPRPPHPCPPHLSRAPRESNPQRPAKHDLLAVRPGRRARPCGNEGSSPGSICPAPKTPLNVKSREPEGSQDLTRRPSHTPERLSSWTVSRLSPRSAGSRESRSSDRPTTSRLRRRLRRGSRRKRPFRA